MDVAWKSTQLPENVPVDPVDLRGFFQHFPLFPSYLHLDQVDELSYGGHMRNIMCTSLQVTCHSRLQLNNFSVSGGRVMGNSKASLEGSITSIAACSFQTSSLRRSCHGQLQGISRRLDHIDRRMLLSNKYGILLLTFIHPSITASSYRSSLFLFHLSTSFHVIPSLLMT